MATAQPQQHFTPADWGRFFWRTLSSPGHVLWLLALGSLGCLLMGLVPQIPLEILRDPGLVGLWLVGIKAPWSSAISTLHSIGFTHLIHSRLFYVYCSLVAVMMLVHLVNQCIPRWVQPRGKLNIEQWRLTCSQPDTLVHLERSSALIGLRLLQRPLPHAIEGDTTYAQVISQGFRRWGSVLFVLGLITILATGILTSWYDAPNKAVAVSPGDTLTLPGKPGAQLQLENISVLARQGYQEMKVASDWQVTGNKQTSQFSLLPGHPVHFGASSLYLLGYGPSVKLDARDANGKVLTLQRVLGDSTPQDFLNLRFDHNQQEQLVTQQALGILLRLIHYPSLPAQGITGRALHIQILRSDTGELLQQVYLDKSESLSIQGISVNISFDYYVLVQAQNEPWLWLVIVGAFLTLTGLICTIFLPQRELWLALTHSPGGTWCQVWVTPNDSQASWMQAWRSMIREVADVQL